MQEVECTCLTLPLPAALVLACPWDGFRGVLLTQEVSCPSRSEGPRGPSPVWGGEAGKSEFTFCDLWMHVNRLSLRNKVGPSVSSLVCMGLICRRSLFLKESQDKELGGFFIFSPQKSPTLIPSHFNVNIMGITVQMRCILLLGGWWL